MWLLDIGEHKGTLHYIKQVAPSTPLIDMVMKKAECPSAVRFTRLSVMKNVRNIFFSKYNDKIHKLRTTFENSNRKLKPMN